MIVMRIAITPSLNASSLVLDTVYPGRLGDGASAAKERPLAWLLSGRVCSGALGKATGQVRWGTGVWMSADRRAGVGRPGRVIKVAASTAAQAMSGVRWSAQSWNSYRWLSVFVARADGVSRPRARACSTAWVRLRAPRDHGLAARGSGLRRVQGSGRFFQGDTSDWRGEDACAGDGVCHPFEEFAGRRQGEVDAGDPGRTQGLYVGDVVSRHRGTARSYQRGERGKAGGFRVHHIDEDIDAVRVGLSYRVGWVDRCVIDRHSRAVRAHALRILASDVCAHTRPGVRG